MPATHKATVIARQLAEDFKIRSGLVVTTGLDADANPLIKVGAQTAGSQSALIRLKQVESIQTDGIGLPQRVYTPHVIQVVLETSTIANVPLFTIANLSRLMLDVTKFSTKVEIYMSANGNSVGVEDIVAANLKVTLDDLYHPLTSSM
ncbi:hypothetical protein [Myxococcus phage Mx1]|nr:hypothetical protein [Myxococcus phage Mx1]